jgi:hypothetical protein
MRIANSSRLSVILAKARIQWWEKKQGGFFTEFTLSEA